MSHSNSNSVAEIDIVEAIMAAISELGGSDGTSLDGIEWYLTTALKEVPDRDKIQSSINYAVEKNLLSQLPNGNYKIVKSTEREHKSNRKECDCSKLFRSRLLTDNEKIKEIAGSKEEDLQEGKSSFDKVFKSKPANVEAKRKDTSRHEKDAQDAKDKVDEVVTWKVADGEAKTKTTSQCEKDAQDAKSGVDKGFVSKLVNGEVKTKDTARRDKDAQEANLNAADSVANRHIKRSSSDDDDIDDLYMS